MAVYGCIMFHTLQRVKFNFSACPSAIKYKIVTLIKLLTLPFIVGLKVKPILTVCYKPMSECVYKVKSLHPVVT